jgi:endonuclease G
MKKIIILLLLLSTNIFGQVRDSVYKKTDIFEVIYSEKFEQPLVLKYQVLCPNGNSTRKGLEFYIDKTIKTSNNEDYLNNVYDKGHLAPAADFNCDRATLKKTFTYLNCALQYDKLNKGVWKSLEERERVLARYYKVYVEIRCVFSDKSKKLKTGATVPDGFYKIIKYNNLTETYYFPNKRPLFSKIIYYQILE